MDQNFINRRQFIAGITATLGAAMTPIGARALEAASTTESMKGSGVLTPEQLRVAEVAAEIIIPTTDTPGASAAGVHHFINKMVTDFLTEQEQNIFVKGLDELASSEGGFLALTQEKQITLLTERDKNREDDEFFKAFKEAVVFGYYTSEIGASVELNYDPVPGPYKELPFADVGKIWS